MPEGQAGAVASFSTSLCPAAAIVRIVRATPRAAASIRRARVPETGRPTQDKDIYAKFLPEIRDRCDGIINITTVGGKQPGANSLPTTVTRAAGLALTKARSKELAPHNILVNTVCIGKIKSGQHERRYQREGIGADEYYARVAKDIPLKRVGEAEEVANVIAFLASDAASYVTGSSLNLDGGISGVL